MRKVPQIRRVGRLAKWSVIYVALFVLGAWLASFADDVGNTKDALDEANQTTSALAQDLTAQKTVAERLEAQVRALGEKPVVTSPELPNLVEGIQGERGPGPTTGQLVLAVQIYCVDHGGCIGPRGASVVGPKGDKGDTVMGPPGESITGPKGDTGSTGADGKPGRGIVSGPTCQDDGTWLTTYDQEPLTETQTGPCRVLVGPPVEPSSP